MRKVASAFGNLIENIHIRPVHAKNTSEEGDGMFIASFMENIFNHVLNIIVSRVHSMQKTPVKFHSDIRAQMKKIGNDGGVIRKEHLFK